MNSNKQHLYSLSSICDMSVTAHSRTQRNKVMSLKVKTPGFKEIINEFKVECDSFVYQLDKKYVSFLEQCSFLLTCKLIALCRSSLMLLLLSEKCNSALLPTLKGNVLSFLEGITLLSLILLLFVMFNHQELQLYFNIDIYLVSSIQN